MKTKIKQLERAARRMREKAGGQARPVLHFQFADDPGPDEPGEEALRFDFGGPEPVKES